MSTFAERIKQLRAETKLSSEEFARKIYFNTKTVQLWEKGNVRPCTDALIIISKTFRVSADWLLGLSDRKERD